MQKKLDKTRLTIEEIRYREKELCTRAVDLEVAKKVVIAGYPPHQEWNLSQLRRHLQFSSSTAPWRRS